MSAFLYPYKTASAGAKALANSLGIKMIKQTGSKFVGSQKKLVINWGNSESNDEIDKSLIINKPENVALATNKLSFFNHIRECNVNNNGDRPAIRLVPHTTDIEKVGDWLSDGSDIIARTVLNGSSGQGIILLTSEQWGNGSPIPAAKLYTRYVPKKAEYRVHVMNGTPFDVQRKARRQDWPDDQINWKVRNLEGGFVFVRNPESLGRVPRDVYTNATAAVQALGLNFGAVDILWNQHEGRAYVLEVNTAPGLEGTTLTNYTRYFLEHYHEFFVSDT